MNNPALLAFTCGFVSLSLEILWVRLYGFAMLSTPMAFGFVLLAYLLGIAIGARQGGKTCNKTSNATTLWRNILLALVISALLTVTTPLAFTWMQKQWWRNPLVDLLLIAAGSSVLAYIFPIAHHLGAPPGDGRQGQRFAWVYTANVMGAALGPLATGYILLNFFTLQQSFVFIAILQLCAVALFLSTIKIRHFYPAVAAVLAVATVLGILHHQYLESNFLIQRINSNSQLASQVIENRHGIITIFPSDGKKYERGDDAVYGGNVYDGRTNLSLDKNSNSLHRPLLLAAIHPEPKRVLIIGLSIGSWLALVNSFPGVEHVDVVEINNGYLGAADNYPLQAKALRDPRVNIHIDDARRWLRRHPEKTYDVIIMNTTWHWRANAGFLLSKEFLQQVKGHMRSNGIVAFNATGSPDAFNTATKTYNHAYRYENFIYAADFDFREEKRSERAREVYANLKIEGKNIITKTETINDFLSKKFYTIEHDAMMAGRPLETITDGNALTEFKYGYSLMRLY